MKTENLTVFSWIQIRILIQNLQNFVSKGPIDTMPALFWIMDRHLTGDRPLSEPMVVWCIDAYIEGVTCYVPYTSLYFIYLVETICEKLVATWNLSMLIFP